MTQNDTNRVPNEDQFFEWWNGDNLVDYLNVNEGTPLYWAMQGWIACAALERKLMAPAMREWINAAALGNLNKEAEKNGEEL